MTPETYDFRNPARRVGERERRLDQWLAAAGKAAAVPWGRLLPFPAKLEPGRRDEALPEEWLSCLPEGTLGVRVRPGEKFPLSLLVLPPALALSLLDGLMGEVIAGMPADVPLTPIDESLLGHLTETLLLRPLRETWPGPKPLELRLAGREHHLRNSRLFPAAEAVYVCPFRVTGPFGELDWCWLLPRGDWLTAILPAPSRAAEAAERDRVEKVAREFPLEMSVPLGNAEVSLAQLSRLAPGDLLLLDQPAGAPLTALVSGVAKFRVRPGVAGQRQAIQIETTLEGEK
jgi:flagellar motor switch protein FliN/FliY